MAASMERMASEQEFNINFVQEIEKHPCLYNTKLPEYMRKDLVGKTWQQIGKKFNLTGTECKEKWKNLRSVFCRHLRPRRNGNTPKKPYYLTEFLQFTIPFVKALDPDDLPLMSSEGQSNSTEAVLPTASGHSMYNQAASQSQFEFALVPTSSEPTRNHSSVKEEVDEISNDSVSETVDTYFEVKRQKVTENFESDEQVKSNKMFLLSLLTDVNKMNDKQRRTFKRKVLALVDDLLD